MPNPFDSLSQEARRRLRRRTQPKWTQPMLATLADQPFSAADWIFERKLDGVRCLAFRSGSTVRLVSRNGHRMNATWPELVDALAHQPCDDVIVDGEIVAFAGGRTSFERLQERIGIHAAKEARASRVAVYLYLFDVLHLAGHDTTGLAQRDRKTLLRRILRVTRRLRHTPHRNARGEAYLAEACAKGWEGLIAKDAGAGYVHGRSNRWRKLKCDHRQEFVIGGYTDPQGSRSGFGALLLGYHEDGALHYAGKVGTGFDQETLEALRRRLGRLRRRTSAFAGRVGERDAHFVRPVLVAEIGFTEWTRDGKLRHPRFIGLRHDKDPGDVQRERPGA
ncbi:MAG: non-homologous end-joining DNA ligase [Candidatus Eiseniibacteriota bacterium]|jgi:bifunctional non-homologous end joining protein LigD